MHFKFRTLNFKFPVHDYGAIHHRTRLLNGISMIYMRRRRSMHIILCARRRLALAFVRMRIYRRIQIRKILAYTPVAYVRMHGISVHMHIL